MGSHCPLPARLCLDSEAIHWPGIQGHPWGTFRSMKQDTPIMQSSTKDCAARAVYPRRAEEEDVAFSCLYTPKAGTPGR